MKGLPCDKRLEVLTAVSPRRVLGLFGAEGEGTEGIEMSITRLFTSRNRVTSPKT